ncbi:MAG: hypothetical protein ACXVEE_33715 [Polyangiales bacterium]
MKRAVLLFLVLGCSKSTESPAPEQDAAKTVNIEGTLAVDIRQTVAVKITPAGDLDLVFGDGEFGFFDPNSQLHGKAATEKFPEASMVLYTASFSLPARASSPCAAQPISLHLSLSRRAENARVGGGLTAYCGDSKVPARVFRLTGDLPLPG